MYDEQFTHVERVDPKNKGSELVIRGPVSRNKAHGPDRIPHAAVSILAIRRGTRNVFIHKRSLIPRNAPGKLDLIGGHVTFEEGKTLRKLIFYTAARETEEELLLSVKEVPLTYQEEDFEPVGSLGQFEWGHEDSSIHNVEYSTALCICIPESAVATEPFHGTVEGLDWLPEHAIIGSSPFDYKDSREWLPLIEISWDDVLSAYQARPGEFADGIGRIIEKILTDNGTRRQAEQAISRCW